MLVKPWRACLARGGSVAFVTSPCYTPALSFCKPDNPGRYDMRTISRGFSHMALVLATLAALTLTAAPSAEASEFHEPMVDGHRLDWCREWAANCGKPAADAFCRAQGFDRAAFYERDTNIG